MSAAVTGNSGSPPPQQRTIISHRDLTELAEAAEEFDDPSPAASERGGNDNSGIKPPDESMIDAADDVFQRAASATPGLGTEKTPGATTEKPKAKPKSRTTTPKPAAKAKAPKPPKSPKPTTAKSTKSNKPSTEKANESTKPATEKATKASTTKSTAPSGKPKTTWAGETGPDNAVTIDGEQQWEISDIVGQEGDVLLVKWKGWKGVWEEDHAVIAESAPELVKAWEAKIEKLGKEKAMRAERTGNKGAQGIARKGTGRGAGKVTARKAAMKAAGGKGRAKKVEPRKGAKVTKAPKKAEAAKSPKKNVAAASPKKAAAASPKKSAPSPKKAVASPTKKAKTTTKASGSGAGAGVQKKRGRPSKK